MEIFQSLSDQEKSLLVKTLEEQQLKDGEYLIREGQIGDAFYIVAEGNLVVEKRVGSQNKPTMYYKEYDYFGEIALIKEVRRQASIRSLTKAKVYYLKKVVFKRMFGSFKKILKDRK